MGTEILKGADRTTVWDLVDHHTLRIPAYQRFYEWTVEQWEQLLDDIEAAIDSKKSMVLGIIFLEGKKGSKTLNIIDGQQRILTFLILLRSLTLCGKLRSQAKRRLGEYIGEARVLADSGAGRVQLNSSRADKYFQYAIIRDAEDEIRAEEEIDGRWRYVRNINGAKKYFVDRLRGMHGQRVRAIRNFVEESLEIVAVQIEDEFEAFEVFESINSKKADLSIADLTKNLVLRKSKKVSDSKYASAVSTWDGIAERELFHKSTSEFSRFLRVWWASREQLVRGRGFFKLFRGSKLLDETHFMKTLADMRAAADYYQSIASPQRDQWGRSSSDKEIYAALKNMSRLGLKTVHPLLIAIFSAKRKNQEHIHRAVVAAEALAFVKIVLKKERPGPLEVEFSTWAIDLSKGRKSLADTVGILKKNLSEAVRDVKHDVLDTEFDSNLPAAFVLAKVLRSHQNIEIFTDTLDLKDVTVEHILPENLEAWKNDIWADLQSKPKLLAEMQTRAGTARQSTIIKAYHEKFCYSIGNLAFLTPSTNSKTSDDRFQKKIRHYENKEGANWLFKNQGCVIGQKRWGSSEIESRAEMIAQAFETSLRSLC